MSEAKIQITLLILRRGALFTQQGKAHDNTWKILKGLSVHQCKNILVIWFVVDQRLTECILDGVCSQLFSFIMLDIGPGGKSTRK